MIDGNARCAQCDCARTEHGECPKCSGHVFVELPAPASVTFDVADDRVHRYCVACSVPPDLLRGEGVSLGISGPIPWGLEPDREVWGYIVGYDSATRRLEVAPKR